MQAGVCSQEDVDKLLDAVTTVVDISADGEDTVITAVSTGSDGESAVTTVLVEFVCEFIYGSQSQKDVSDQFVMLRNS